MIATDAQTICKKCNCICNDGSIKAGTICARPATLPLPGVARKDRPPTDGKCGGTWEPYYPNRHVANGPDAQATAARLLDSVQMLAGCVIEMMEKNPAMVLSPVMRRLLLDQAKALDAMLPLVGPAICVDIPEGALAGASWLK